MYYFYNIPPPYGPRGGGGRRIGSSYDHCGSLEATEWSSITGLEAFPLSLSSFPVCYSSPMRAAIARVELRGFTLCTLILFFLCSSHSLVLSFSSTFLALMCADSGVVELVFEQ